jgi:hypothetical protein
MKKLLIATLLSAALLAQIAEAQDTAPASKRKDCAELRGEIAAKLDAKGVRHYRLEVVAPEALGEAKQVGSCDGGTRRIAYQRLPAETAEALALSATDPRR